MKKSIRKQLLVLIEVAFVIGVISCSVIANVSIQNMTQYVYNVNVIILKAGQDNNVKLAVDTFQKVYPKDKSVKVINIHNQEELFYWIIAVPHISRVIFGHGIPKGLVLPSSEIITWKNLETFINTKQNNFIPVMACYSGQINDNYGGVSFEIDAEAAGIFAAFSINSENNEKINLDPELLSIAFLKQKLKKNPLCGIGLNKWYSSAAAADLAINLDRCNAIEFEWTWKNLVNPTDIFQFEGKNPYAMDVLQPQKPIDTGLIPIQPKIYIVYCINGYSFSQNTIEGIFDWNQAFDFANDVAEAAFLIIALISGFADLLIDITDYIWSLWPGGGFPTKTFESIAIRVKEYFLELGYSTDLSSALTKFAILVVIGILFVIGVILLKESPSIKWKIIGLTMIAYSCLYILSGKLTELFEIVDNVELSEKYEKDTDNDGITDFIEGTQFHTNIYNVDTDGDNYNDKWEIINGFNPCEKGSPGNFSLASPSSASMAGTLLFPDDYNKVKFVKHGLEPVDRIKVWQNGSTYHDWNVSEHQYWDYSFWNLDNDDEVCEWTEYKVCYYKQNNTEGTSWILLYTEYYYSFDNDYTLDEYEYLEDPVDADGDWIPDVYEDIIGTGTDDHDHDNDGIFDNWELFHWGTSPLLEDSDFDGILDTYELSHSSAQDGIWPLEEYRAQWDVDGDGLPNWLDFDADGDGLNDSYENTNCDNTYHAEDDLSNWLDPDTDDDGLNDGEEILIGTDPEDSDTDDDGFLDGWEVANGLNPKLRDTDDWALVFSDDFAENVDNDWDDISSYGEMRTGGLATTTAYNNFEANEDFVIRVQNSSSGEWTLSATERPTIAQYTDGSFYGFVTSWNLTNLRSSGPAEAIESATVTLDFYSNTDWDAEDKIKVSLVYLFCNGSYLNDSSSNAHANYSLWFDPLRSIEDITINATADSIIDITTLVDRWYLYSNNTMMSLLFAPDPDNAYTSTETIIFDQGTEDPAISIVTGDSVLRPSSYGILASAWHGPKVYHNIGCAIDDFELTLTPFLQYSTAGKGQFTVSCYTGDNGTGTQLFKLIWYDASTTTGECYLQFYDQTTQKWTSDADDYQNWYEYSDNATIYRNESTIKLFVDGVQQISYTGSTTTIKSLVIHMEQYDSTPVVEKLGLRAMAFRGHSIDYDADGLTSTQEHSLGTNIWKTDSDDDEMPDNWEDDYCPPLDPAIPDADEDPDEDLWTNLEEYEEGQDPTVADGGTATINANSYVSRTGESTTVISVCYFDVTVKGVLTIKTYARYKHWGQSYGDWILKDSYTYAWNVGYHNIPMDQVWYLTYWYQFCAVDVRWEIWSDDQMIDEYWGYYSRTPSGEIYSAYLDAPSGYECCSLHATAEMVVKGDYKIEFWAQVKEYGSETWSDWTLVDYYTYQGNIGYVYPSCAVVDPYNYFDSVRGKVKLFARQGDSSSYGLLDELTTDPFTEATPDAHILSSSDLTQSYHAFYDSQRGISYFRFDIDTAGEYTFRLELRINGGNWYTEQVNDYFKEVGSYPTSGYELIRYSGIYCPVGTLMECRWRIEVNGHVITERTDSLTLIDPCYVHADSYIYQSGQGTIVYSYMKLYLRHAPATYYIKVEYKKPSSSTWITDRWAKMSWDTTGLKTITDALFVPDWDGTCYVRWSVYDWYHLYQYDTRTESKYVYAIDLPPWPPLPIIIIDEEDRNETAGQEDVVTTPTEEDDIPPL